MKILIFKIKLLLQAGAGSKKDPSRMTLVVIDDLDELINRYEIN